MLKDTNTTTANTVDDATIASAKINPITNEKELDLVSGSGVDSWGQLHGQVWGQITF